MMKLTKSSRAFRRATAFILAAAMTLSAPVATQASAASKKKVPSLSVKKKTLYYNKAGKKSFTLKIKKNKVKKIVKTKWTTSKKSIVKISAKKKTKVKVTAIKKGSAKIKAKVTYRVKAGSKAKTKTLTCKVTSKKQSKPAPATETPATSGTPATDTPATDVPATDVPATDVPATDVPSAEPTTEPSAEPTEEPADATATGTSISAVDPSAFEFTVTLQDGKNNEAAVKNAKLELKKDSISVTASFKEMDGANTAIFKIDDSKKMQPKDRSADGKYAVTTTSKSLTLAKDAYTTYEEVIAALAVEGFVTTPKLDSQGDYAVPREYVPVADATVTLVEGGKKVKTDANGFYRMTTSSGKKTMMVEKDGYIGQITGADSIIVNKSQLTSQNFVLATFKQDKVQVKIEVRDSKTNAEITDANVQLLDAEGKAVANVEKNKATDTRGRFIFANCDATIANTDLDTTTVGGNTVPKSDHYDKAEPGPWPPKEVFLEKGKTYTIRAEKALSRDHITSVYEANTAKVTIEAKHTYKVVIKLRPIEKLPALEITQKFAKGTEEFAKSPDNKEDLSSCPGTGAHAHGHMVYNEYFLLADTKNGDNIADLISLDSMADVAKSRQDTQLNSNAEITLDLLKNRTSGDTTSNILDLANNGQPTLPTGTYYLLIKSYKKTGDKVDVKNTDPGAPTVGADYTVPTTTDYTVAELKIEEGKKFSATITRTLAGTLSIDTNIEVDKITGNLQSTATGTALKAVKRSNPDNKNSNYGISGTTGLISNPAVDDGHSAWAINTLYQKMSGDILVEVEKMDAHKLVGRTVEEKNIYVAQNSYLQLTVGTNYLVRTNSNVAKAEDVSYVVKDTREEVIHPTPCFKISTIKFKAQTGDALIEKKANLPRVTKIRVLDKDGKELDVKDYPSGRPDEFNKNTTPAASVVDNAIVAYDSLKYPFKGDAAQEDYSTLFKVPQKPGEETVKIEVTLDGCKPVTSDALNVTDLEELVLNINEKVLPTSGRTALSGTVTINNKDKSVSPTRPANGSTDLVQVTLYKDGKIAGYGLTADDGKGNGVYEIKENQFNKLEAGEYKLVARGKTAETIEKTITLKNQENVTENLIMDEGAQGSAKVTVTDTNMNPLGASGPNVVAYDSNYVRNANWLWLSGKADPDMAAHELDGRYEGDPVMTQNNSSSEGSIPDPKERLIRNLSVGSYTVHFWDMQEFDANSDVYAYTNQSIVLAVNGESKRPKYTFNPKNVDSGDGRVNLTIFNKSANTTSLISRIAFAKPLDENGKELDQIEGKIVYLGNSEGTYPQAGTSSEGALGVGNNDFSVIRVTPHKTYNVYVYDFTSHYVVKQVKNVEGVNAEMYVDYSKAQDD